MGDPSDWDFVSSQLPEYEIVAPLLKPATDWDSGVEQLACELPKRSVLIGYSMGARLSLAMALSRPQMCAGLVFVSGNPGLEDDAGRETRYTSDCRIANRIEREPRRDFLHHWYTESTVFKSLTDTVREDEISRKLARSADDWSAILRCFSVAKQPNFWPLLSELTIPTFAIAGMSDRKYAKIIARMGTEPNIQPSIISECGHIVHREQPRVFIKLLRDYLSNSEFD